MKNLTLKQALGAKATKRTRPYKHKAGAFQLTANFRDSSINETTIQLVGALSKVYTQKELARLFETSTATIGKMVRAYHCHGYGDNT